MLCPKSRKREDHRSGQIPQGTGTNEKTGDRYGRHHRRGKDQSTSHKTSERDRPVLGITAGKHRRRYSQESPGDQRTAAGAVKNTAEQRRA